MQLGHIDAVAMRAHRVWGRGWFRSIGAALLFTAGSVTVALGVAWLAHVGWDSPRPSLFDQCRWDCKWYASIVQQGYQLTPKEDFRGYANWAFFPAFPLIAKAVGALTGLRASAALILTSILCMWAASAVVIELSRERLGERSALLAGALVAANPYLVYGVSGYSEPLYLLLSAGAFLALGRDRWVVAGLIAGALSATRVVGVLFALPYAIHVLRRRAAWPSDWPRIVLGAALIPSGVVVFAWYLRGLIGDGLAFDHVQVAWGRSLGNPIQVLHLGLQAGGWDRVYATIGLLALAMSAWLLLHREYELGAYLAGTTLVPIAAGLLSLPRFVFWQLPMAWGALLLAQRHKVLTWAFFACSGAVSAVMLLGWYTGKSWVI